MGVRSRVVPPTKYMIGELPFQTIIGDPKELTVAEFKSRVNNLLGYNRLEIHAEDSYETMIFYFVEYIERVVVHGKNIGAVRKIGKRTYYDNVLDPYADVIEEIRGKIGKISMDELDDDGCERLAAKVLEEVFTDYKIGYSKSLSLLPGESKRGEFEMSLAKDCIEHGIGSSIPYLPTIDEICKGLEDQVNRGRL